MNISRIWTLVQTKVSFVQFTVLFVGLFIEYFIPKTFTVYQTFAISPLAMFFVEFLSLFGLFA